MCAHIFECIHIYIYVCISTYKRSSQLFMQIKNLPINLNSNFTRCPGILANLSVASLFHNTRTIGCSNKVHFGDAIRTVDMSPSMDTNPNLIVPAGGGHIFVFGVHIYLSLAKSMVMHGPESRAKLWIYTYIDIYLFIYMYILTIWDSILDTHTRHRFTSVRISQRIGITN